VRLTTKMLQAIVEMACIATAAPEEGDYEGGCAVEQAERVRDWAHEQLIRREARRPSPRSSEVAESAGEKP
jgi:hypothetical protein